ncbi:glycosyltransferase [Pararhizobium mangrovi]|uniref:Glycosyltransferase n=1 Tax=Pararhizobium mangrovi TaxID=2590452 RepID=A0A506U943_9HYPH|nr:glycosyltransferase [Pararhizobium mangrovi]TPW29876.1 glycosyltransferase [Pararhizobium mangrovi]
MISIVIPCRNEADNLAFLLDEIARAMAAMEHEVIVVDDGSTDATATVLADRASNDAPVRHLRHDRSAGQSAALRTGMIAARGAIVATLDGDGQNDPAYLPLLVARLEEGRPATGLVAGHRIGRTDTRMKQISSRFANGIRSRLLADDTHDSGCGLKALPTEVFRRLPYFDGWHRYLPALVLREGYRVAHVDVIDRERRYGRSNYGILDRGLRGVLDLFGVWWLRRRMRVRPKVEEVAHG